MAVPLPSRGPYDRMTAIALEARKRGHVVASCAAEDSTFRPLDGVPNYYAPMPKMLGIFPFPLVKAVLPFIQKAGLQEKREIVSFEQVLHLLGASREKFFERDVSWIQRAIREFRPDVVYVEVRPAAIVAARLEKVKTISGMSRALQPSYAASPEFRCGVNRFLAKSGLSEVASVLDIFDWPDIKITYSSKLIEPVEGENVFFVGPTLPPAPDSVSPAPVRVLPESDRVLPESAPRNVIVYMGSGAVSEKTALREGRGAFENLPHQLYIASSGAPVEKGNLHVGRYFDFNKLMPNALLFVNHGGQNSVMTGLIHGVPQIVCPGSHFERRFNAEAVARIGAGVHLDAADFKAENLRRLFNELSGNEAMKARALQAAAELQALGGAKKILDIIETQ